MKDDFVVKDSGQRQEYKSGMRRDTQEGKPDYELIDLTFLKRLAMHLTKGAQKYGEDNWRKANSPQEYRRFKKSAFRHLMQWMNGEEDEDHMAAVCFNLMAAEHTKEKFGNDEDNPLGVIAAELEEKIDALLDADVDFRISGAGGQITIEFYWLNDGEEEKHVVCFDETQSVLLNESDEDLQGLINIVMIHVRTSKEAYLGSAINLVIANLSRKYPYSYLEVKGYIHKKEGIEFVISKTLSGHKLALSYWIAMLDVDAMMTTPELLDYHVRNILRRIETSPMAFYHEYKP